MCRFNFRNLLAIFILCSYVYCIEFPADIGEKLCTSEGELMTYDAIICGAGSAGGVLATRLSEEASMNILLLELGEDPPAESYAPMRWATNLMKTRWDYQYVSETNGEFFKGLKDEKSHIPGGRLLGGGSSVNCALYLRPTKRDMQKWEETGLIGWSHDDIYRYMLKAESFHDSERFHNETHNLEGYLEVSPFRSPDELIDVFSEGLQELGLEKLSDFNTQQNNGYGNADGTILHGLRSSSATGYLSRASYRTNLFVARKVLVRKVLVNSDTMPMKAIGVEITAPNGVTCSIYSKSEVILSLGAIRSPQILMLSGIGPKEHVEEMNIPLIADLPVGDGYKDHVVFPGVVFSDRKYRDENEILYESNKLINETFVLFQEGIGSLGLTQLMTFLNTDESILSWHDIQIMKIRISRGTMFKTATGYHKMYSMFGWSDEAAEHITALNEVTDTIFLLVILSEVNSKGHIRLKSTNVEDQPIIQTNILSNERDLDALMKGIKFARELARTKALQDYGLQLEKLNFEPCAKYDIEHDEYWLCAVKQVASGFYHPSCTVRMGAMEDNLAVLTSDMKVKGFHNLRVIDASSMATLVSRNPNAAVIMMAETMSDKIKLEHNKRVNYETNLF